jgi:VWFA-related protein
MMMTGSILAAALLAQGAPVTAPDTEVRALTVNMLDEKGEAVVGLERNDVAVLENGVARDITSFKPDRRPLSVALLVDTSANVGSGYRLNMVKAIGAFVSRLPLGARYAIWTTGDRPEKILDYTDDRQAAEKALNMVAPRGGNYMLDALSEASADLKDLAREGDRSAVVAITTMGPEFSYRDRYRTVREAEDAADLFLALEIDEGDADFETRTAVSYVLDHLTRRSGGAYERVLSSLAAESGLRKLSPYLAAGYRLAYATVPDLKKRKVEVTVARPGTQVLLPAATDTGP